jgi:hypothetical protein
VAGEKEYAVIGRPVRECEIKQHQSESAAAARNTR